MSHPLLKTALYPTVTCFFLLGVLFPLRAFADDDPSRGMIRSLNVDSAAVQNTYYLSGTMDNDNSTRHYAYLYGEGVFALDKDLGLEADIPNLILREPIGQGDVALGPLGLNLRYVAYQFGTSDSEEAGVFSIEGGGAYAFPNSRFKFLSGSLTPELLAGYRVGKWFFQGNYAFNELLDRPSLNNLVANTGVGYTLNSEWFLQVEADSITYLNKPLGTNWTFVPQVAFQTGDWLFELGEVLNQTNAGTTDLLVARAF